MLRRQARIGRALQMGVHVLRLLGVRRLQSCALLGRLDNAWLAGGWWLVATRYHGITVATARSHQPAKLPVVNFLCKLQTLS